MPDRGGPSTLEGERYSRRENGMKASAIEFRLRMWIQIVILFLGFWAPWIGMHDLSRRISTIEWLALEISRMGLVSFTTATPIVIVCGAIAALIGAVLRVWGVAYLGYGVVHHGDMQGRRGHGRWPLPLYAQSALRGRLVHDPGHFAADAALGRALLDGSDHRPFSALDSGRRGISCGKTRRALPRISACGTAVCPAPALQSSCRAGS